MAELERQIAALAQLNTRENPEEPITREEWAELTNALFAEPVPKSTLASIDNEDGYGVGITLEPMDENGEVVWKLYIPPTQPEAFEFDPEDITTFDPLENDIRPPWGHTYWNTLSGALASLQLAYKAGQIKFNDGRIAE